MSQHIVYRSVKLKADPAKVWDALTNPEMTKKYFFNCEVFSDWKEGSSITFKGRMFWVIKVEMTGTIDEVQPGTLLQYTLHNRGSETSSTVTDILTYKDGQTILSISDDVGDGEGADKRYKKSEKGWDKILAGLKKVVEA